jgi:hypothetical protein
MPVTWILLREADDVDRVDRRTVTPDTPNWDSMPAFNLLLHLLLREEWRDRPGDYLSAHAGSALAARFPAGEDRLIAAAAAVSAGEPKRALRLLDDAALPPDGDLPPVATAIRAVATTLERNWFPGGAGAVLEPGDVERLTAPAIRAATPEGSLLALLATRLVVPLPTWRSLAEASTRSNLPLADPALQEAWTVVQELSARQVPAATAPAALALADLLVRARRPMQAGQPLGLALQAYQAAADPVGVAACTLAQGDWSAESLSHPELLGEDRRRSASRCWPTAGRRSPLAVTRSRLPTTPRPRSLLP